MRKIQKKTLKENSSFTFYSKLTHETKTSIFVDFRLLQMKKMFHLVALNVFLNWYFYWKNL